MMTLNTNFIQYLRVQILKINYSVN